jgi:hypothetical protein
MKKLSAYTVESIHIATGRKISANVQAVSARDALRFEKAHFGEPFFRVLRAYPKLERSHKTMKCPHCDKTYTLGKDGTIHGCDDCTGAQRNPAGQVVKIKPPKEKEQ